MLTVALFLAASFPDSVLRAENTCDHTWELKVSAANGVIPSSAFYECTKCHEQKDLIYGRSDHFISSGSTPLQAISYGGKQVLGVTLGQTPLSHPKTVYNLISFEKRTKGTDGSGNPVMQEISTQAVESACNTTDTVTAPEGYTPLSDLQFAAGSGGSRFAFSFAPLFNLHYNTNGADSDSPERASDTVSLWKSWTLAGAGSGTPYFRSCATCTVPSDFSGNGTLSITWFSKDATNQTREYSIVRGGSCSNWRFLPIN